MYYTSEVILMKNDIQV